MIISTTHRVTGKPRATAVCDHPGCEEGHYLPSDVGVHHGGTLMRDLGWTVSVRPTSTVPLSFSALCPTHGGV